MNLAKAITPLAIGAALVAGGLVVVSSGGQAANPTIQVYKTASCGCCNGWIEHLEAAGYQVEASDRTDMASVKNQLGVARELGSCHTGVVEGYVIEGHVPADVIARLLTERPAIAGLAVPGMPEGSPGMEGPNPQPYEILAFDAAGNVSVYDRR
jgi:hypothetical protein